MSDRIETGGSLPIRTEPFYDAQDQLVTGLAPTVRIARKDGQFWTGSGYQASPVDLAMSEIDAVNLPGLYEYVFVATSGQASEGEHLAVVDANDADVVNAAQTGVFAVGGWVDDLLEGTGGGTVSLTTLTALAARAARIPSRIAIPYRTDLFVRLLGPVDVETGDPIDATEESAAAELRVYDAKRSEILAGAEAGGQVELSVTNAGVFAGAEGGNVEVALDDGTVHETTLASVDATAGTLVIDDALPSGASAGKGVRIRLGAPLAMAEFGTPGRVSLAWGFQALLPDDHPGIDPAQPVDLEIGFVGAPGGGYNRLRTLFALVSRDADDVAAESAGAIVPRVKAYSL